MSRELSNAKRNAKVEIRFDEVSSSQFSEERFELSKECSKTEISRIRPGITNSYEFDFAPECKNSGFPSVR